MGKMQKKELRENEKVSLVIRILAGGYLLYLSYQLLDHFNFKKAFEDKAIGVAGVLFLLIGVGLCGWAAYRFYRIGQEEQDIEDVYDEDGQDEFDEMDALDENDGFDDMND